MERINRACKYYPCHNKDKLQDCTFCYCPFYPCMKKKRGVLLSNGIWDCSKCTWIHSKSRVDKIFRKIRNGA